MKITFLIALITLMCFVADAQNDSAKFLRGRFFVGGIDGGNQFRVDAYEDQSNGTIYFSNIESHAIKGNLGFGFLYKKNKAIILSVNGSASFSDFLNTKQWNNSLGAAVSKMALKNIYNNKFFVSVNQRLDYSYDYVRAYEKNSSTIDWKNPIIESHTLKYSLLVGALYQLNNNISFQLNLPLFNLGVKNSETYINFNGRGSKSTDYSYTTSFLYSFSQIQLGVLWSPNFIQSKKNK